jgi:hypothetical protein
LREETKRRLDRALWLERAKYLGIGLSIVAAVAVAFGYETLDMEVDDKEIAGHVTDIEPLVARSSAATGENVIVKLDGGPTIRIQAYKSRGLKVGDQIEVVEHHHATGRVTHSLK